MLDVLAVEQALAALMRRCASLPEQAPPSCDSDGDATKAAPKSEKPSEPIIPADMKLPRCARKASWAPALSLSGIYHACPLCQSLESMQVVIYAHCMRQ